MSSRRCPIANPGLGPRVEGGCLWAAAREEAPSGGSVGWPWGGHAAASRWGEKGFGNSVVDGNIADDDDVVVADVVAVVLVNDAASIAGVGVQRFGLQAYVTWLRDLTAHAVAGMSMLSGWRRRRRLLLLSSRTGRFPFQVGRVVHCVPSRVAFELPSQSPLPRVLLMR